MIQLARILNTFHCLKHKTWAHGNLTSHNVFVDVRQSSADSNHRVQIDGMELTDLKKYANMFYSYRPLTVWSSPEVLRSPKKLLDPLPQMDIYSFGFLMWELFHEQVPFDNNIDECKMHVCHDNSRPRIEEVPDEESEIEDEDEEHAPLN